MMHATHGRQAGPEQAVAYLYLFRRVVVGLALASASVAWAMQVPWLLAASVCIAIGELLETSYYIGVLRWGQRRGQLVRTWPRPFHVVALYNGSRGSPRTAPQIDRAGPSARHGRGG